MAYLTSNEESGAVQSSDVSLSSDFPFEICPADRCRKVRSSLSSARIDMSRMAYFRSNNDVGAARSSDVSADDRSYS